MDGVIADDLARFTVSVTLEVDRWVLEAPGDMVQVFLGARDGEQLTPTVASDDARICDDGLPLEVILNRVTHWRTNVVGTWDLVSIVTPELTVTAGTCTTLSPGTSWGIVEMTLSFKGLRAALTVLGFCSPMKNRPFHRASLRRVQHAVILEQEWQMAAERATR